MVLFSDPTAMLIDIADRSGTAAVFKKEKPQRVRNLAAQAGVRYSLQNPHAYVDSDVVGFVNERWPHAVGQNSGFLK